MIAHSSDEDWRVIRVLNLYRWTMAVGACALTLSGATTELFEVMSPRLFTAAWIAYLLLCIPSSLAAHWRSPRLLAQVYTVVAVDIGFVVVLVLASSGVASGLGMLLIAPIAGASILVPGRMAAAIAAVGSLSLIIQELGREIIYATQSASLTQAGILGLLLFMSALGANSLASRARQSAALAAARKSELDDMAVLNERIIQRMQMGLIVVDEQRHIRLMNNAARQMLNLPPTSLGQTLSATVPPLAWALEAWQVSPQLSPEPFSTGRYSLLPRFTRLGHDPNAPVLIFIEDAHRAREQAQQMKLASLGHLTASIAHEIRNPLSAISHASQLLDESEHLNPDDHRMLDIVQRHTSRIDRIIKSVLGLSRRNESMPAQVDLAGWLARAASDYQQGRQDAPEFIFDSIAPELQIQADPNQLRQILYNLWENAERHARVKDRQLIVQMRAGQDVDSTWLDIADNGPGLHGYKFAQLIEPFFTTTSDGTGLGLYIVRELCEANAARLELSPENEHIAGTCFRITFATPESWTEKQLPAT